MDFVKFVLFAVYMLFLMYAFIKGREFRMKRKEKKLNENICRVLGLEELPKNKRNPNINWEKVDKALKKLEPSTEIDGYLLEVNRKLNV